MKTIQQEAADNTRLHSYSLQLLTYFVLVLLLSFAFQAQAQEIEWDKTLGGNENEGVYEILQTNDGGYIVLGVSGSGSTGDKSDEEGGLWVVKLDKEGNKEWDRTFGGHFGFPQQTSDGGYILGGTSSSGTGGDRGDYMVVKLDADGNKEWERTFGGNWYDYLSSLLQTSDGGYILGGTSYSEMGGDKKEDNRGECVEDWLCTSDYWVVKIDANGNKEWDRTYGGAGMDWLNVIRQTIDGGYIIGGSSDSDANGDKTEGNRSGWCESETPYDDCTSDYWVVKIDADGKKEWDRTYGGLHRDWLTDLQQTSDGGYILGGHSNSRIGGDKTEDNRQEECEPDDFLSECNSDYWVVKLDANGNKEWDRTFGGTVVDQLYLLEQTSDGGFILGGGSSSDISGDKSEPSRGGLDYWVVKLDVNGNKEWDKTIGGSEHDYLSSLLQTSDGGYILGGRSSSGVSGDKSEPSRGGYDYWVVKLSPAPTCTPPTPAISVVPTSDVYTGGDPATLYLGYGPQSVRLAASGAASYAWSPAEGLSDPSVADPIFTPSAAGIYTFTLTAYNGDCAATAMVVITVVDVRCGKGKVLVCHKGQEICISTAAVAAHLRQHSGDRLGSCQQGVGGPMAFRVHPNPFSSQALVEFSLPVADTYRLELYNAGGKMLGVVAEGRARSGQVVSLELRGDKLREGMYYLRLITPAEVQTTRLVLKK